MEKLTGTQSRAAHSESESPERLAVLAKREAMTTTLTPIAFEDGCVIEWQRLFGGSPKTYMFVAVKIGGEWYVSGQEKKAYEWEALIAQHLQYAESVWLLTAAEQLA